MGDSLSSSLCPQVFARTLGLALLILSLIFAKAEVISGEVGLGLVEQVLDAVSGAVIGSMAKP